MSDNRPLISTGFGDGGMTSMLGGVTEKHSLCTRACGAVEELCAHLGASVSSLEAQLGPDCELSLALRALFPFLSRCGHDLAVADSRAFRLTEENVSSVELAISVLEGNLPPLCGFIMPLGSESACRLHIARTVCRRAEREVSALLASGRRANSLCLPFLNRVGDLLFLMSRRANALSGVVEEPF